MKHTLTMKQVVKGVYFSNWCDNFGYPIAFFILPFVAKISFITPNIVTIFSFMLYTFGSASFFLNYPFHNIVAAVLIILGYIGDDLDGQLARYTKQSSLIGDFLDKVLDVLKIYIITISAGIAAFFQTDNYLFLLLAMTGCFFFTFRYYIKLETMFSRINLDDKYLEKSSLKRTEIEQHMEDLSQRKGLFQKLSYLFMHNRPLLWIDEAEIALLLALGGLFNRIGLALVILAISQVLIGFWRFYERMRQIQTNSDRLLWPLRK